MTTPRPHWNRPRAVIYIRTADAFEAADRCHDHCKTRDYDILGVVAGDWTAVQAMLADGTADVVIVDSRADLPHESRYEVVAEQPRPGRPGRRRTHRFIRRDAGA